MKTGARYVYDPTGVQFGASWPLIQNWEDWVRERGVRVWGTRRLGGYQYLEDKAAEEACRRLAARTRAGAPSGIIVLYFGRQPF
jgi:hypothetical protein